MNKHTAVSALQKILEDYTILRPALASYIIPAYLAERIIRELASLGFKIVKSR